MNEYFNPRRIIYMTKSNQSIAYLNHVYNYTDLSTAECFMLLTTTSSAAVDEDNFMQYIVENSV